MGVQVTTAPVGADVVIDALVGYSLVGEPHSEVAELIDWATNSWSRGLASICRVASIQHRAVSEVDAYALPRR